MKSLKEIVAGISLVLGIHPAVLAQQTAKVNAVNFSLGKEIRGRLWCGAGGWGGDVTYEIGGKVSYPDGTSETVNDPLSRLEWPLGVVAINLGGQCTLADRIDVYADGRVSVNDPSGKMEDTDWLYTDDSDQPTIYSESDTELDAYSINGGMRIWLVDLSIGPRGRMRAGLGGGCIYQYMKWKTKESTQWSPWSVDNLQDAAAYHVKLTMPYAGLAAALEFKRFRVNVGLDAAPWLSVKDEDDHILRHIKSETDADGHGGRVRMEACFYFTSHICALAHIEALYYKADGTEKDHVYAGDAEGESWEIDHSIESSQVSGSLALGLAF